MGALATPRAARIAPLSFSAWRIVDGKNYPIETPAAEALGEAVDAVLTCCQKGETFAIRITDSVTGKQWVEFYKVRQKAQATYVRKSGFAHTVAIKPLYADRLFWTMINAFEPTEPFRWTPGCDVVGLSDVQRNTVEG